MSGTIVVAGEALVDLVPDEQGRLVAHAGGGPYNTSRTLARLQRPVQFLGALGDDRFGAMLRAGLADDGVGLDLVAASARPTTLAVAEVGAGGSATYRFYAEATSAFDVDRESALARLAPPPDVLHLGGLGLVVEPMASALEAAVEAVRGRALVLVDPNVRPTLIADPAGYRARLARVLAGADVVKLSTDDLAWLEPGAAPAEAARTLVEHGPAVAVVTAGPEGAIVVGRDGERLVPAEPVTVVDTIGAGDAFGGGLVAWWQAHGSTAAELRDLDAVAEAARFASLVAGRTCERAGADPPRLAELSPVGG
jgi:fructokinase